jgi:integrase
MLSIAAERRNCGFHDLHRAFATANHGTLPSDALQRQLRHKNCSTTQRYINMAGKLTLSVAALRVSEVLRERPTEANTE